MKSGASSSLAERWTSRRDGEDVMDGVTRNTQRTLTGSLEEKRRIRRKKKMEEKKHERHFLGHLTQVSS